MSRPTSLQQDLFCILLLAVFSLTLWLSVLDEVSLNPDERQYEATASYLVASNTSAFLPNGAPGMFGLFKLATLLADPYPIFIMRVLTMASAFTIAMLLFQIVRSAANRWCGLISGLVFLHGVAPFEGFAVNREWFASLVTVLGLGLFVMIYRHERTRAWLWVASGFLCGMALWFKLQASFITLVVPAVLLAEAAASRSASRLRRELVWFAASGIGAGLAYLAPFFRNGTLAQFLEFTFSDVRVYVGGNEAVVQPSHLDRFVLDLPHRPLFLIAYALAAVVAGLWIARSFRRDDVSKPPGSVVSMFAAYLILAMICVQLGDRFYAHYFQLMLPAVAGLVGLAVHVFPRLVLERSGWRVVAAVLSVGLILEGAFALWTDPNSLTLIGVGLGALALLAYWLQHPLRRAGFALVSLIVLHTAVLVGDEQLAPRPASMSHNAYKYVELTEYFERRAHPGDRLFVWGWAPEIYSLTRLEAASHITFCQYVANDLAGVPDRPSLNQEWARMLMNELNATRPRFIVDASRATWFETEAWIYDLRNYPDFELNTMLETEYREVARVDDCPIWERVDADEDPHRL